MVAEGAEVSRFIRAAIRFLELYFRPRNLLFMLRAFAYVLALRVTLEVWRPDPEYWQGYVAIDRAWHIENVWLALLIGLYGPVDARDRERGE